jgi:DNA polymerase-3 subunit alpha
MPAIALTDHGALYGAVDFYVAANQAASSRSSASETYVARTNRFERDPASKVTASRSTWSCSPRLHRLPQPGLPRHHRPPRRLLLPPAMDKEILRQHSEGLIALSACLQGELARAIQDEGSRRRARSRSSIRRSSALATTSSS